MDVYFCGFNGFNQIQTVPNFDDLLFSIKKENNCIARPKEKEQAADSAESNESKQSLKDTGWPVANKCSPLQLLFTLPENAHLNHVEIAWSNVAWTVEILHEFEHDQHYTYLCGVLESQDGTLHRYQKLLAGYVVEASSAAGFLLRKGVDLFLVPAESEQVEKLKLVRGHCRQNREGSVSQQIEVPQAQFMVPAGSDQVEKLKLVRGHCSHDGEGSVLPETETPQGRVDHKRKHEAESDTTSSDIKARNHVDADDSAGMQTTFGEISGTSTHFVASYDNISVGTLCVEKEWESLSPTGHNRQLTLTCLDSGISISHVSCGLEHSLFLTCHGTVLTCGTGSRGQLGHGSLEGEKLPRVLSALEGLRYVSIAAGGWHSTAVSECGDLYVWGWNESGQLGLPSPGVRSTSHQCSDCPGVKSTGCRGSDCETCHMKPVSLHLWPQHSCIGSSKQDKAVKKVACGVRHTVVLSESGDVFATGWNKYYQLGLPHCDSLDSFTPVLFPGANSVVADVWCGAWNSIFTLSLK